MPRLLPTLVTPPRNAADADSVRARAAEVGRNPAYQHELPADVVVTSAAQRQGLLSHGANAEALGWILLLVLGVVALAQLLSWIGQRRARMTAPVDRAEQPRLPQALSTETGPSEPANDLGAAIHDLLLRALGDIERSLGWRPAASWTGREILARAPLQPSGRSALATLIQKSEKAHFGGHAAKQSDFEACLEQYRRLAAACQKRD